MFGIIHFVFFSPEDLNIIKDGPSGRRRFIDLELSQLDKVYLSNLSNYNRIINQRNSLLKDIYKQENLVETLDIWDMQLVEYGTKVMESRKRFIEEVNEIISDIHYKLTGGKEHITLSYECSVGNLSLEQALKKKQGQGYEAEKAPLWAPTGMIFVLWRAAWISAGLGHRGSSGRQLCR